jgi:hypothetical protein
MNERNDKLRLIYEGVSSISQAIQNLERIGVKPLHQTDTVPEEN